MGSLGNNGESFILDYCLGLTSGERTARVEAFIASSERAAEIHGRIQAALGPLASLYSEPCPEELAERTVRLLCAVSQGAQVARTQTTYSSSHTLEDCWQCLSRSILMKLSS
jgi:anti-sigma-K factor RskA